MTEDKNITNEKSESQNTSLDDANNQDLNKNISLDPENDQQDLETTETPKQELIDNTVEELVPTQETLQSPANNMELHHPHIHHKKKWKEYLFEFLMLFVAITAGFFVENKRENYVEHERAVQFSKQLLADLRLDSVLFENRNRDIQGRQTNFDRLLYLLTQKRNATDKEILEVLFPLTFVFDVPATTTTYNQMKASGSLRYIENPELTAHLQDYYDVLLPRSINISKVSLDFYSQNINPFYLKHIRVQDFDSFNDTLINKNAIIMQRTGETNQELANIMGTYRSLLKIQVISMNDPAVKKIKETIEILKDEYHLQ